MEDKESKISFFKKTPVKCPVCGTSNRVEELLTGRGRLNAGELTPELRRLYEETKQYGKVTPIVYPLITCHKCFYSAFPDDFLRVPGPSVVKLEKHKETRLNMIKETIGDVDFEMARDVRLGTAGYILATHSYSFFDEHFAPTFKRGLSALRASWLLTDLFDESKDEKYLYMASIFHQKAAYYYEKTIELEQKGKELLSGVRHFGPDTDKNYGYDGVKYIACYLKYSLAPLEEELELRVEKYLEIKRILGRLFGLGTSSKEKPGPLLDIAKNMYYIADKKVKDIEEKVGKKFSPY